MTLPNILTISRILMSFVVCYFYQTNNTQTALIIFIITILTDFLDGFIARKFNMISNLGKLLDPLADKILVLSVLLCFVFNQVLSIYVLLVIFIKELFFALFSIVCLKKKIVVYSLNYGKLSSIIIYGSIVLFLLDINILANITLLTGVFCSLVGCVHYALKFCNFD